MISDNINSTKVLIAKKIKQIRKSHGYTQEKLAELIGRDTKHISKLEIAGSYPSIETLERIASVLNVKLKDFFDFEGMETRDVIVKELENMINNADEKDLKLVYSFWKYAVNNQ